MTQDVTALLWSYLYVGTVVAVGEGARRLGLSTELARKIIHVGVGLWIFGTLALFQSPYMAVIPPLTAAAGNWVIHRKRWLKAVEAEPENLGTVWFPISFAVVILAAWGRPGVVAGGIMAMTVGDALASTVGLRWGRHPYLTLQGKRKSLEGSLAMFLGTLAAVWATVAGYSGDAYGALVPAALAAVAATCVEALGINGLDNLFVPPVAAAALYAAAFLPAALGIGSVLALLIGVAAWLRGSLSASGVLGAVITGTLLFGFGGWTGGLALIAFFVSSSLLSRLFRSRKAAVEEEYAKTGTRDLGQALANGGVAAAAAALLGATGDVAYLGALLGALAAANADTWATELGVLARSAPRLITTWQPVSAGSSGAISFAGTVAAAAGAAFVALVAAPTRPGLWPAVPWLTVAGLAGCMLDSLLGATLQSIYYCPACRKETERRVHRCGTATVQHRGARWLGNDMVNLLATLTGAVIGYVCVG